MFESWSSLCEPSAAATTIRVFFSSVFVFWPPLAILDSNQLTIGVSIKR